jgi:hypothetical protein
VRIRPLLALVLLAACPSTDEADPPPPEPTPLTGDGLFSEGCPAPGAALARVIGTDAFLPGEAAVGTAGDFLLANEHAAFVITDTVGQSTYWYYGGALADAAPMRGCEAGEDKLDELGIVFVQPDLFAFEQSILRAFRADTVEVVADGSDGGAAIVRAYGTDDFHWLVEHTLINQAANSGGRPYSEPYGAAITFDYILEPGSPVLQFDINVINTGDSFLNLADAALFQYGASLDSYHFSSGPIDVAGLNLDAGLPWLMASDGDTSYALGIEQANLATVTFSGVEVGVDLNSISDGFSLSRGEGKTLTRFLSVGDGDGSVAVEALMARIDAPLRDQPATPGELRGRMEGEGVVRVQAKSDEGDWGTLYSGTAVDGEFRFVVPELADPWDFRLVAGGPGRDDSEPVAAVPGGAEVDLVLLPHGSVDVTITNDGAPGPARLHFVRDDGKTRHFWLAEQARIDLAPGVWDWTASRGYEFNPDRGTITVPDNGDVPLSASLTRAFDTDGWISVDTHVHSSDSPDSRILPGDQLRKAAAHGLDIVVHTEHENIVDRSTVPAEIGVAEWVNNVIGEEVTSVLVEHMTMFPAVPDDSPRGGPVHWYGQDIDQLFANMRERSDDGVNLINHPGYLDHIGWDRVLGGPTLADPTLLGFQPDSPLWSWNLDGIEVMNGHGNIFIDGNRRFDNWMSMVNTGKKMIAVGCSDDHGGNGTGFPRTYVRAPSDAPADLDLDALTDSFKTGQAMASAGGFAAVSIDGSGPGDQLTDTDGEVTVDVRLWAMSEVDVTHFVVFANCDQVASVLATSPLEVVKYDGSVTVPVDGDSHIVVAAFGSTSLPAGMPQYNATRAPRVLTNPIYIDGDGDGAFSAPGGRECTYAIGVDVAE